MAADAGLNTGIWTPMEIDRSRPGAMGTIAPQVNCKS
jgi:hypothetical protein